MTLFRDELDSQDNWFRPGIKTAERVILTLEVLGSNGTFGRGGGNWQRGKTTCWESTYKVCLFLIENYIGLLRFPAGAYARQCITEFKDMTGLPNIVAAIDGTHIKIQRPNK